MKTFENEAFTVEMTEESGCRAVVKIIVKPQSTKKAYQKAVKAVNKRISIPGFRKGKAPDRTVIGRYSSYVDQEWKDLVVNEAYRAALELSDIYPMSKESIQKPKIESCSQEEGAVVHVSYEHAPHVPTIDFSQIEIPPIEKEDVPESKVEEILEEVRRANADWEDVTERAVQEGDFVDVSINAIDTDPPKPIVKDRRFEVSDSRLAPWLTKLLVGLKVGEKAEGMSEVDEKAEESVKKNFKPTKVEITLHAIKKILLPEVNDELAKKVGAESTDDLRQKIRQNLETEAEDERNRKRLEILENALLEKYPFDLPASLVESEKQERMNARLQNMSEEEVKEKQSEIEEEVLKEIDRTLRLYFLNKQIAKQGNLTLSNQELNDEIVRQISQNPYLYNKETDKEVSREMISRMASNLLQRKAKEFALSQVS